MRKYIIFASLAVLAVSCSKEIPFTGEYSGEKIVMYSSLNPESGYIDLRLSKSKFFLSHDRQDNVLDGLKGAKVSGTVNGLPLSFSVDSNKPGVFLAPCTLKEGDKVELRATHPKLGSASASSVVPAKASFSVDKWSYDSENNMVHITVTINDNASTRDYYRIALLQGFNSGEEHFESSVNLYSKDIIFMETGGFGVISSILGDEAADASVPFEDVVLGGEHRSIELFAPVYDNGYLDPCSGLSLEVQTYSEDLYKYAVSVEAARDSDFTGFFSEGVTIHNNVQGGIGCVAALNTSRVQITEIQEIPEELYNSQPLDQAGSANCYILLHEGIYRFNATTAGNGAESEGLPAPQALNPTDALLVWQDAPGMISDIKLMNGTLFFRASQTPGNAVIGVTDGEKIIWSWHIWYPEEDIEILPADNGYLVMNMNLGAMMPGSSDPADTYGTLYQWGRKDPLPGSPVATGTTSTMPRPVYDIDGNPVTIGRSNSASQNTLEYATAHPEVVISNATTGSMDWLSQSNNALWGNPNPEGTGSKSIYDPCPAGFALPPADVFRYVTPSGGYEENVKNFRKTGGFSNGWNIILNKEFFGLTLDSFFPAAARYDGGYAMLFGSVSGLWGSYWSNTVYSDDRGLSPLSFTANSMSPSAGGAKADAYSVRCVLEDLF